MQKKFSKISLLILLILTLTAPQVKSQGNLPYVDDKPIHFGFSLGVNFMDFAVVPDSISRDVSTSSIMPGFSVGAIADLRLSRYFNLRFTPTLMLGQRTLNYSGFSTDKSAVDVISVPLYLPVYLKYSSERNGNIRPYVIAGGGLWMDWGRNKEKAVLLKPYDVLMEAGVGCDLYFSFFKLSPELKFSLGMDNMLTPISQRDSGSFADDQKIYTDLLSKLTTRMITLTFNFE